MRKTITASVLLSLCSLTAVASAPRRNAPSTMLVRTAWLAAHLNDRNLVILHVGTDRSTYDAQHIPGARFLALSEIAVTRNGIPNELPAPDALKATFERLGVGDQSRVVLYGDMAGLYAARAYFTLDYLGHGNSAALLDGGLEQWRAERRPVSNTSLPATRSTFTVKMHPELLVSLAEVKQMVSQKRIPLIDARPQANYAAAHIPGAKSVFWVDNLQSRENPVLKPVSSIRARYQAAGIPPGGKAVVYCQTGIQAAWGYFTLKLAGFRPALYDGSFVEWGNAPGSQVER